MCFTVHIWYHINCNIFRELIFCRFDTEITILYEQKQSIWLVNVIKVKFSLLGCFKGEFVMKLNSFKAYSRQEDPKNVYASTFFVFEYFFYKLSKKVIFYCARGESHEKKRGQFCLHFLTLTSHPPTNTFSFPTLSP